MEYDMCLKKLVITIIILSSPFFYNACTSPQSEQSKQSTVKINSSKKKVIIYVWDGLRPDVLTDSKANIPNLRLVAHAGVEFSHNHSAYPTFTMDNAQVFATGDYAGKTGFYGNVLYEPWRTQSKLYGKAISASGKDITAQFSQPIFTEDYEILQDLDGKSQDGKSDEPLVQVTTLLREAHKAGLTTAVVGKSGPAFFQDYKHEGIVLDENHVWPVNFAKELQQKNIALPKNSPVAYAQNELTLLDNNGNPSAADPTVMLTDNSNGSDPQNGRKSPFNNANEYMADIFMNNILPEKSPDLNVLWLRNPDTTEHIYGPGSFAYYDALESNDRILGKLLSKLKALGIAQSTDLIIVSDHSHSNVLATKLNDKNGTPQLLMPLHEISPEGRIGNKTETKIQQNKLTGEKQLITSGYSVSGTIRTADLITGAHLKTKEGKEIIAFDGAGCSYNFSMSAVRFNDGLLNTKSSGYHSADGKCLNGKNQSVPYTSQSYIVPDNLNSLKDKEVVVIGANGGSDYVYIPSHNTEVTKILLSYFEQREEYGALFVDDVRYPKYQSFSKGVLPLALVKLQNISGRNPDIVVSMTSNSNVIVNGLPGVVFDSESSYISRGTHGTFGKVDVHNTLIAYGPDFKNQMIDTLPTGNVDVAPTVAHLFHLTMPNTDGRPLFEALNNSNLSQKDYSIKPLILTSSKACNIKIFNPTTHIINFSSNKIDVDHSVSSFYTEIHAQVVSSKNGANYTYFDYADGVRKNKCD